MGRGFILGTLWGLLVAIVTISITSLMQGRARVNIVPPQTSAIEVPAGTLFDAAKSEEITVVPQIDSNISGDTPPVTLPQSTADQQPANDIAASTKRPDTGNPTGQTMVAPKVESETSSPAQANPIQANETQAPDSPTAPTSVELNSDSNPDAPSKPEPASVDVQTTMQPLPIVQDPAEQSNTVSTDTVDTTTPDAKPEGEIAIEPASVDAQTNSEMQPEIQKEPTDAEIALPNIETPTAPETEPTPQSPEPQADSGTPPTALPDDSEKPVVVAETDAPESIRSPVFDMGNMAPNIPTNRLPTIATPPDEATAIPERPTGALYSYSVNFEALPDTSLMSIILIDDESSPISNAALHEYPVPVAFAIDATRKDATRAAKRYRDAGFEVLMLTNFPVGATPSDIEQSFQAYATALPEAIAVLDQDKNGFRRGRDVITQISEILASTGQGLITMDRGLNTPQKIATKEGVPAAVIYRLIDEKDESPTVIRRYLNRAAFQAGQKGSVILVGRTRPATVEALLLWSANDKSSTITLAPVSTILKTQSTQ